MAPKAGEAGRRPLPRTLRSGRRPEHKLRPAIVARIEMLVGVQAVPAAGPQERNRTAPVLAGSNVGNGASNPGLNPATGTDNGTAGTESNDPGTGAESNIGNGAANYGSSPNGNGSGSANGNGQ